MSKTTRRLLKLGPTENSTRVIAGIQARKLIQVALVAVGKNRNGPEILFLVMVQAFGARKRVDGLKGSGKSGAVVYRTRMVNCAELGMDF
jgi:hypothetical protein